MLLSVKWQAPSLKHKLWHNFDATLNYRVDRSSKHSTGLHTSTEGLQVVIKVTSVNIQKVFWGAGWPIEWQCYPKGIGPSHPLKHLDMTRRHGCKPQVNSGFCLGGPLWGTGWPLKWAAGLPVLQNPFWMWPEAVDAKWRSLLVTSWRPSVGRHPQMVGPKDT